MDKKTIMAKNLREHETIELRQYAEKVLTERLSAPQQEEADPKRLLHELQVHQIELETQNEQLRQAQLELESSLTRYTNLYELAPVGYLTLTPAGFVDESNYATATMLGVEWAKLLRRRFDPFVAQQDIAHWYQFFAAILREADGRKKSIKLALYNAQTQSPVYVQMNCVYVNTAQAGPIVRIAITEVNPAPSD